MTKSDIATEVLRRRATDADAFGVLPPLSVLDPVGEAKRTLRKSRAALPDKIIDAIRTLTDEQISYAETRRGPAAEYADMTRIDAAENRLRVLLAEVLDVTVAECDASHD